MGYVTKMTKSDSFNLQPTDLNQFDVNYWNINFITLLNNTR